MSKTNQLHTAFDASRPDMLKKHALNGKKSKPNSVVEMSAFALHVYRDKDQPPIPKGYEWFCDCPISLQNKDYFGAAYICNVGGYGDEYHIVIAHRGTVFTSFDNIMEDVRIALGKAPISFKASARPFVAYVREEALKRYPHKSIYFTHTGHSLGAILAELCVADKRDPRDSWTQSARTFESLGSKPIIEALMKDGTLPANALEQAHQQLETWNAKPNLINTCNEQAATAFLHEQNVGYDFPLAPPFDPISIDYYISRFTVDQHKMVKMYRACQKMADEKLELKPTQKSQLGWWPIGFSAGYQYYLTYYNLNNYWELSIKNYWDTEYLMQVYFKHNYNDFYQWMRGRLNPTVESVLNSTMRAECSSATSSLMIAFTLFLLDEFINFSQQIEARIELITDRVDELEAKWETGELTDEQIDELKELHKLLDSRAKDVLLEEKFSVGAAKHVTVGRASLSSPRASSPIHAGEIAQATANSRTPTAVASIPQYEAPEHTVGCVIH